MFDHEAVAVMFFDLLGNGQAMALMGAVFKTHDAINTVGEIPVSVFNRPPVFMQINSEGFKKIIVVPIRLQFILGFRSDCPEP